MTPAVALAAGLAGWMAARLQPSAAMAGGVLLVGALAVVRRPALGLGGLLALAIVAPFVIVPVRVGAQPPVIAVLLALLIGATALAMVRGSRTLSRDRILIVQALYLLLVLLATGIAWPIERDFEALQTGLKLAMAAAVPLLVVMWLPRSSIRRHGQLVIVGAAAVQAALAVALHLAGDVGIRFLEALSPAGYPAADIQRFLPDEVTPRATGLLVDPNVLGVTLAMALPFAMVGCTGSARRFALQATAIGLIAAALMLTLSRGSWVGAAVAALYVIASTRPRLGAGLALAGALGLIVPWPGGLGEAMRAAVVQRDLSDALRLGELQEAARVIGRYPWFGVGYGASPDADVFVGVSNTWLWIAERAGVLAAASALGVVVATTARAVRVVRRDPMARACAAGLAALLAASLVDHHLASFQHLAVLGGVLVGATLVVVRRSP
ncbi:MAG: O-antigen ligase family protein [Chloroflexi bacterium]|nr:O-antigen ligase family protein [Chloroflexota bacterium]